MKVKKKKSSEKSLNVLSYINQDYTYFEILIFYSYCNVPDTIGGKLRYTFPVFIALAYCYAFNLHAVATLIKSFCDFSSNRFNSSIEITQSIIVLKLQ